MILNFIFVVNKSIILLFIIIYSNFFRHSGRREPGLWNPGHCRRYRQHNFQANDMSNVISNGGNEHCPS